MARPLKRRYRRTNAELADIDAAIIEVVEENAPISLRGVYYRVLSMGLVGKSDSAYNVVGRRLLKLRRSGDVGYADITDGTRWVVRPDAYRNINSMLHLSAINYKLDLWERLDSAVWLYCEKDAITGTVLPVTRRWCIPVGVVRGYASETLVYNTAVELADMDKPVHIYQLGDHDPSGTQGWESFQQKIEEFAPGVNVTLERLAVTCDQIVEYDLPEGMVNEKDTRSRAWIDGCPACGAGTVQVDALPPGILRAVVEDAVLRHATERDLEHNEYLAAEEAQLLQDVAIAKIINLSGGYFPVAGATGSRRKIRYDKRSLVRQPANLRRT